MSEKITPASVFIRLLSSSYYIRSLFQPFVFVRQTETMKFSAVAVVFALASTVADAFVVGGGAQTPARTSSVMFASVEAPPSGIQTKTKAPVFDEVCDTTGVTLTRFMNEVTMLNPELKELTTLFGAIDTACKAISNLVKRSQLPSSETLGYQGEVNVQGEDQKKLDVITNDLLKRALRFTGRLGVLASEEEDAPVSLLEEDDDREVIIDDSGKYVAVFDVSFLCFRLIYLFPGVSTSLDQLCCQQTSHSLCSCVAA